MVDSCQSLAKEPLRTHRLRRQTRHAQISRRFYLIGSDQWKNFHTWKHWKELFNYVTFVIVVRNGIWEDPDQEVTDFLQSNHIEILKMPMPAIDMDSSRIRTLLTEFNANRDQLRAALPAAVFDYLKSKTASKAC